MPKKLLSLSLFSLLGIAVLGTIAEADQRAANTLIPMVYANSTWSAPSSTMSQVTVDPSSTRFLRPMEVVLGTTIQPRQHTYIQCWGSDTGAFRLRTPELEANQDAQYHIYSFTGNEYPLDGPYFISVGLYNAAPISVGQAYQRLVAENGELVSFDRSRLHYVYIHDNTPLTFKCGEGFGIEVEPEVCGDGQVTGNESCDDANTNNGDGCSNSCAIESGYSCNGEPSQCSRLIPTIGAPVGTSTSAPASTSTSAPLNQDAMEIHAARIAGKYLYVQYTKEFDACTRLHKNGRVDMGVNLICDRGVRKANVLALASFRDAPGIGDNVKFCDFVGRGACSNEVRVTNLQGSATTTSTATSFSTSSHYDASYPSSTSASQVGNMELHSAKIIGQYLYMNYTKPFAACATLHRNGRSDKGPNFVCKAGSKLDQVLALQSFEQAPKVGESIHFCDFVYRSSCSNKLTVAGSVGIAKPVSQASTPSVAGKETEKGFSSAFARMSAFSSYAMTSAPVSSGSEHDNAILHSAWIKGDNLEVVYTKHFSACLSLFHADGSVDRGTNFICQKGHKVTVLLPMSKFGTRPTVGESVKVCDFALRQKCSGSVNVKGIADENAVLHSVEIVGTNLEVSYTKHFSACIVLSHEDGSLDRGTNFMCQKGDSVRVTLPMSKFGTAPLIDERVKLCDFAHQTKCSNQQSINGGRYSINLRGAEFSRNTLRMVYSKNFSDCVYLHTHNGMVSTSENICSDRTRQNGFWDMSKFRNGPLSAGAKVRLCHYKPHVVCSEFMTLKEVNHFSSDAYQAAVDANVGNAKAQLINDSWRNLLWWR